MKKKNHSKSRNRRPWYPKILQKNVPVLVPVFLYAFTMLTFQIKRVISSEKFFSYVATFFFFFLKMPKIWVDRTTLNGEKKEDGLKAKIKH